VGRALGWVGTAAAQNASDAGVLDESQPEPPPPMAAEPAASYGAVAVTPAPGAHIALDKEPTNVQHLDARELQREHALSLHDALNARLGSVTINDVQSNPLQPDVQYRGFTASPLLGTPQGLSVYQNGVRLNEPFGDVLQWDLIPLFAISDVMLVPGENPAYGLNTLGGSLVLHMKDGFAAPGYRVEGSAGSFGRYRTTLESGRASQGWAGYAGASLFGEQGFRDKSQSSARNLYADLRRRADDYEVGVGITLADTDLNGNGPAPIELLRQDRAAVYTWPDNTRNELVMVAVDANERVADKVALQGTAYLRHGRRRTTNADAMQLDRCAADGGRLCDEAGQPLRTTAGGPVTADYDAMSNDSDTLSNGFGASLQLSTQRPLLERANSFVLGASYDGSENDFLQSTTLGQLTVDRGVQRSGPMLAGSGLQTDLLAVTHALGAYAVETWNVTPLLAIHASGRLNVYSTSFGDRLGAALDGHHVFARFNPAFGLAQRILPELTLFLSYGESNRAPSAAELSCADAEHPCRLPNAFVTDPPLRQVVTRSLELGARFHHGPSRRPTLTAAVSAFGARTEDEILFVAGSHLGTGYFRNAGDSQRVGLEAAGAGELGPFGFYASYTLLYATFESRFVLPRNTAADGGDTQHVADNARIPGLPLHSLKAGVSWRVIDPLELELSMLGQSSQPFRGDESNQSPFLRGYVILNAQVGYRLLKELSLYVRAQNLLDTKYSTFGVLANPSQVLPGARDPRFLGPGAPFGIWVGAVVTDL
jgi:outer membrane receptor protein involved in Fe transport